MNVYTKRGPTPLVFSWIWGRWGRWAYSTSPPTPVLPTPPNSQAKFQSEKKSPQKDTPTKVKLWIRLETFKVVVGFESLRRVVSESCRKLSH